MLKALGGIISPERATGNAGVFSLPVTLLPTRKRMSTFFRKHCSIFVAIAFTFAACPAHATKWASAILHTKQPIDQVFEPTAKLISSKEWYIGTRWHIQAADPKLKAILATTVSFGQKWGDIYVWMKPEGTGTCIQTVMTLRGDAHLHPAD